MSPLIARASSLNILIVSNEANQLGPGILSAVAQHFALFCSSVKQALESVAEFIPDLIVFDHDLADQDDLLAGLPDRRLDGKPAVLELGSGEQVRNAVTGDRFHLSVPASELEFSDQLSHMVGDAVADHTFTRIA